MNNKYIAILLFFASVITACTQKTTSDNSLSASDNSISTDLYNYETILKNQDSLLRDFSWPLKLELDLNKDGINEEFLAVEGYSRGMDYALFTKINNSWRMLNDSDLIPSAEVGVRLLDTKIGEWYDFVASQPSGRGGIIESTFSWNGKHYILKQQEEVEM
jgi:hypothetical protein